MTREREASVFQRVMRPQGEAIAILKMAIWFKMEGEDQVADNWIAPGPAGPQPFRVNETEAHLQGKVVPESIVKLTGDALWRFVKGTTRWNQHKR